MRKLIRPRKAPRGGPCGTTEIVNDIEFVKLLRQKLVEEALEAERAETVEDLTEELGDLLEVIRALSEALSITPDPEAKRERYGGFGDKMVWTV